MTPIHTSRLRASARLRSLLVLLPLVLAACTPMLQGQQTPASPASTQDAITLTILHINDVHAQNTPFMVTKTVDGQRQQVEVGGYAVIKGYVDSLRALQPNTIFLHAGDDFQGTPISAITKGASQFEILPLVRPDVMTIGNHEFDYGRDNLAPMLAKAPFPIVSANLFDRSKGTLFVEPFHIMTVGGLRIAVVGLAPPDLASLTIRDNVRELSVLDAAMTMKNLMHQLRVREGCDLVVALSHMGVDYDTVLARSVEGIDVIVGGHSHTALFKPIRMPGTVVVQAGARGRYVGKLDLTIDRATKKITRSWGELIETRTDRVTPNAEVAALVDRLESKVSEGLAEVVGTLERDWRRGGGGRESNVGSWMADAMRTHAGTDIAFQNNGGIRKDIAAGTVTLRDFWEIAPFGNELVTFSLTGAQLVRGLEHQAAKSREFAQVSGLRYSYDVARPEGQRLVVTVGGMPVDTARTYTAATNSFVGSHLWDYFLLPEKEVVATPFAPPILDRDLFIEAMRKQKTVASETDGRIDIRRPASGGNE